MCLTRKFSLGQKGYMNSIDGINEDMCHEKLSERVTTKFVVRSQHVLPLDTNPANDVYNFDAELGMGYLKIPFVKIVKHKYVKRQL